MPTLTLTTAEGQETLAAIQAWKHWDYIGKVAAREYDISEDEFQKLLPEYQKFMGLIVLGNHIGMFSSQIDKIWHSHILHTRLYTSFCDQFYQGNIINHVPNLNKIQGVKCNEDDCRNTEDPIPVPTTKHHGNDLVEHFCRIYVDAYGTLPPQIWNLPEADGFAA